MRGRVGRSDVMEMEGTREAALIERRRYRLKDAGKAHQGTDPAEVVIGISPAFGVKLHKTTANHLLSDVLRAIIAGVREGGGKPRVVRLRHTADTSFLGLSARDT